MADRIAVIGGCGFIGGRLVRRLRDAGHDVVVIDREDGSSLSVPSVVCDIRDQGALLEACKGAHVLINLAAEHRDDVRPISLYDEVNVEGSRNLCEVARVLGIDRILFTSSVAVYGFSRGPTGEEGEKNPFNDYGRTKLAAECIYEAWQAEDPSRSLVIVRPTVVFGEDNRGNVYNLLRQVASGPFLMIGDGRNRKSMAYVENVAGFLEYALSFGSGHHVYNYVDKPDYDMNTLVATIRRALGRGPEVRLRIPYALGRVGGRAADLVAAAIQRPLPFSSIRVEKFCASSEFSADRVRESGYRPPVDLETALSKTIAHEFGASS